MLLLLREKPTKQMNAATIKDQPIRADNGVVIEKTIPTVSEINGKRIVHACAWCFPGATLKDTFPALAGLEVSHGICKPHRLAAFADYESQAFKGQIAA